MDISLFVSESFFHIIIFSFIGFVFIRCRFIGYIYSSFLIIVALAYSVLIENQSGLLVSEIEKIVFIIIGTLIGGWRYFSRARFPSYSFGFPFFKLSSFSLFGLKEKFDNHNVEKTYKKTYAEELAKERAKHQARKENPPPNSSRSSRGSDKSSTYSKSNYRSKPDQSTRQKPKREREAPKQRKKTEDQVRDKTDNFRKAREEKAKKEEQAQQTKPSPKNRTATEVLGLSPGFTVDDLNRAHKLLRSRYHTDHYTGMSQKLQDEMAEEFRAVQEAYKKLK